MQWKIYERNIWFHTHKLNEIQIDLIYAHQKNDASTIYAFCIWMLWDVGIVNYTIE